MDGDEDIGLVQGSGNVFADLGHPDAGVLHLKAELAAAIIGLLDRRALSVRQAEALTGIAAADFSRIRNARLQRFTIDRLMSALGRLGGGLEVTVRVRGEGRAAM